MFKRQKGINAPKTEPKVPRAPDHSPDPQSNRLKGMLRLALKPGPEHFPEQTRDWEVDVAQMILRMA